MCGVVALASPQPSSILSLALLAASGIQHRGQQGVGLALKTRTGLRVYKKDGLLRKVFGDKGLIKRLNSPSPWVLVHCRYGTYGGYQKENLQPCLALSPEKEEIAVIHNGEFVLGPDLIKKAGSIKEGLSDTYLFSQILARAKGGSWEEKILSTLARVKGSFSLAIGVGNRLFVARDPSGIRPLIIGRKEGLWIVASETHALDKAGAEVVREVRRGEVIRFSREGLTVLSKGTKKTAHFCDFEWAYLSRPDSKLPLWKEKAAGRSVNCWFSVARFRERCGAILAGERPIPRASFVVGVPDSGIALATGYANASKLPYRQVILRDHYDPNGDQRLFMRDDEIDNISEKVLGKLSLVSDPQVWQGAVVVVGDDSIVRGNVSVQITRAIFSLGAKEVHWVIGFPPVAFPCFLGVSLRTEEELIAARCHSDPKRIAAEIGATSVNYISYEGFIKARRFSKVKKTKSPKKIFLANGGCGGCLTGCYPVKRGEGEDHV